MIVREGINLDGVPLVRLESDRLQVDLAPSIGGRIVSLIEKRSGHEFLWRNPALPLQKLPPCSDYDPNFFGGIDELLPNDMRENIQGINCPDHGELWTTVLDHQNQGQRLKLRGKLPLFGLLYEREISLPDGSARLDFSYRISNPTNQPRTFLWKLHAALAVAAGDVIDCPARKAKIVDPASSRYDTLAPFDWPVIEGYQANVVRPPDGTLDFFYLFDLTEGRVGWRRPGTGLEFTYEFDRRVFRYAWLFASYGGFYDHYTVVVEPCTCMPMSVNEAAGRGQCSRLEAGESLITKVSLSVRV